MDVYTWHIDPSRSLAKVDHRDQEASASTLEPLDRSSIRGVHEGHFSPCRSSDLPDEGLTQTRFSDYRRDALEPRPSNYQFVENRAGNLARSSDYQQSWERAPDTARASDVRPTERIDVYATSSAQWLPNASDTAAIAAPSTSDTRDSIGKSLYAMTPDTAPPMCRTTLREMLEIVQNDKRTVPNSIRQYRVASVHSDKHLNRLVPSRVAVTFLFACDTVDRITILAQKLTMINHYPRESQSPVLLQSLAEHCRELRNLSDLLRSHLANKSYTVRPGGIVTTLSRAILRAFHYLMDDLQHVHTFANTPPETLQALRIVIEEGRKLTSDLAWLGSM